MAANYRTEFFPHKTLTKIQGEPNYAALKVMKKELKTNTQAIPTTLGDGVHG